MAAVQPVPVTEQPSEGGPSPKATPPPPTADQYRSPAPCTCRHTAASARGFAFFVAFVAVWNYIRVPFFIVRARSQSPCAPASHLAVI